MAVAQKRQVRWRQNEYGTFARLYDYAMYITLTDAVGSLVEHWQVYVDMELVAIASTKDKAKQLAIDAVTKLVLDTVYELVYN